MAGQLGSLKGEFDARSRERLLPQKGYELSFALGEGNDRAKSGCFRWLFSSDNGGSGGGRSDQVDNNKRPCWWSIYDGILRFSSSFKEFMAKLHQMGRSDPRKFHFAFKMGMALASVSCLIFWKNPKEDLNKYSIWSILTVVVCFEFSVGASLSKGFNRAMGTIIAGGIAFGIAELASKTGDFTQPLLVFAIFLAGFSASYIKLLPDLKSFEYGFRVFLLTYCIVVVTGSRTTHFLRTALFRLFHIAIGASVASIINLCILPIWAGEDLHKLVVKNFTGVATSLEGCVNGYLQCVGYERIPSQILTNQPYDDPLYSGYRTAVQSSSQEESLLDFAKWEPPHGPYRSFKYPWQQYVKLSGALRYCAFMVMALHGCVLSEIQAPAEKRSVFAKELHRVGIAGAKVLRELGSKVQKMEKLSPGDLLLEVHEAAEALQMKIDQKSHLLVNFESWEEGRRSKEIADLDNVAPGKDGECNQVVIHSLSEETINFEPDQIINTPTARHGLFSTENIVNRTEWPSRMSLLPDLTINEQEARTLESASSLSLATFASILVEFVARLAYLAKSFEELSEVARFKDPEEVEEDERDSVGFWKRLVSYFQFKN